VKHFVKVVIQWKIEDLEKDEIPKLKSKSNGSMKE
jgi:hypothetical protein